MEDKIFVYLIIITIIIRVYIAINELQKGVKPIQSINAIKYLANQWKISLRKIHRRDGRQNLIYPISLQWRKVVSILVPATYTC